MILTAIEQANIQRHLGVPASGIGSQETTYGIRAILRGPSQLLQYMQNVTITEASIVTGKPTGEFIIQPGVQLGDIITVTANGVPLTYTVTAQDIATSAPYHTVSSRISILMNQTYQPLLISTSTAQFNPIIPINQLPPLAQVLVMSLTGATFTLAVSGSTSLLISTGDHFPNPSITAEDPSTGLPVTTYGMLPICDYLENQFYTCSQFFSFSQVGSATTGQVIFRREDLRLRKYLLEKARYDMGVFLAFYTSPTVFNAGKSGTNWGGGGRGSGTV